jgi:hypothetical protein
VEEVQIAIQSWRTSMLMARDYCVPYPASMVLVLGTSGYLVPRCMHTTSSVPCAACQPISSL